MPHEFTHCKIESRRGSLGVVMWGLWWRCKSKQEAAAVAALLDQVGEIAYDVEMADSEKYEVTEKKAKR